MITNQVKCKFDPSKAGYKSIDDMLDAFNTFKAIALNYAHIETNITFDQWYEAAVQLYNDNNIIDSPSVQPLQVD